MAHLVSIVGAGPGDPDLLTVKAHNRILSADFILHDALVSAEILRLAAPTAQLVYVGKLYEDGQDQGERQEWINRTIVDLAAQGKKIVRLKSGDPMIFGRGAEEIRFCIENKLNYEVIPGVTAAIGAAALYGIPLTERGKNSMVLLGTGHYCEGDFCDLDSFVSVLKSDSPVIFYMGLNKLVHLSQRLMDKGISGDTKIQILSKVSLPEASTVDARLDNIAEVLSTGKPPTPALIVVGRNIQRLCD